MSDPFRIDVEIDSHQAIEFATVVAPAPLVVDVTIVSDQHLPNPWQSFPSTPIPPPTPEPYTAFDGGSASAQGSDALLGGSATSVGTDTINGGHA
jgi:hypothetical protein